MKKGMINIQNLFFRNMLITSISVFVVAFTATMLVMVNNSINILKQSRLDVLSQIQDRSELLNHAIISLANDIYNSCSDILITSAPENYTQIEPQIENLIYKNSAILNRLDMSPSVIILMKNNFAFSSSDVTEDNIEQISSSYWYIDNLNHTKASFWSSRYFFHDNKNDMELCYATSILNSHGEYIGLIIVSIPSDYLQNIYQDMINKNHRFYILDENGTSISHSFPSLLGNNLFYMPYFREQHEQNSSQFLHKATGLTLFTNVYSPSTGWTIVEEVTGQAILNNFIDIIILITFLFCFCIFLSIITSYFFSKKISAPIVSVSKQLLENEFAPVTQQTAYKEIHVLSTIYNLTLDKMNGLIEKIKQEEEEKRKLELSFLQAQINPHFLHNTLFSIKCLIEMGDGHKASDMLSQLLRLLKFPIHTKKEWIYIRDEINYLKSYLTLMQYRYSNCHISMELSMDESLEHALIPRFILQPIVENSIFHGFDNFQKNAVIHISFKKIQHKIMIRIQDNGKGMTPEELKSLWDASYKNTKAFNRVGLINIRERIKLLYGEEYDICISSEPDLGTEIIITLRYKEDINNGTDSDCG